MVMEKTIFSNSGKIMGEIFSPGLGTLREWHNVCYWYRNVLL